VVFLVGPLLAEAQITTDGTIGGAAQALTGPNFQIDAALGAQSGANLFHSFALFNVNSGESATFLGPSIVENIIARVTGGSVSNVDGTIRSSVSGASLWLINPAGVVFGANAQLDVQGSFYLSTADYLRFGDGSSNIDADCSAGSRFRVSGCA
jgi:filamentous hemagglutinin family protein